MSTVSLKKKKNTGALGDNYKLYFITFQVLYVFYHPTDSGAVSLTSENIDMTLGKCYSSNLFLLNSSSFIFCVSCTHINKNMSLEFKLLYYKLN